MIVLKRSFLITFLTFFYFSIKSCGLCELFEYKINLCELPNELQAIIAQNILQNEPEILYPLKVTEPERTLLEHTKLIFSVDFINNDEIIASTFDSDIFLYDLKSNTCKNFYLEKADNDLRFIAISPNKKFVAMHSISSNDEIKVWLLSQLIDNDYDKPFLILSGHKGGISSVKFSADSKFILSTSFDCTARLWDLTNGGACQVLDHEDQFSKLVLGGDVNEDNSCIITICEDMFLRIWHRKNNFTNPTTIKYPVAGLRPLNIAGIAYLHFSFINTTQVLIALTNSPKVYIFDIKKNEFLLFNANNLGNICSCYYNRDTNSTVISSVGKQISLYLKGLEFNSSNFENDAEIVNARNNNENTYLVTTSLDKKVKLWSVPNFQFLTIKQVLFIKFMAALKKENNNQQIKFVKLISNFSEKLKEACKEAFLSFNETQKKLLKKRFFLA